MFCGKDYEKSRMAPGRGAIVEDPRRKGVYRLYARRNCHHVNTHDPLKAMGLVANVDDQVVLTVQASVNYLTKYMGKLGGGNTATGRIGSLIDTIICKMKDNETMTVAALLSKLFIHAAVPEDISSLETWHMLLDLPRTLSSRYISALSKNDVISLKPVHQIATGTQGTVATQQVKVNVYMERLQVQRAEGLNEPKLKKMSFVQFVSQIDKRGRGRVLTLRRKSNIVKEKPYLQLDVRRHDAADMARYCLRLHRPFLVQSEDPSLLDDQEAVQQLHHFVEAVQCPLWIRKRFQRHNRVRRRRAAGQAMPDAITLSTAIASSAAVLPVAGSPSSASGSSAAVLPAAGVIFSNFSASSAAARCRSHVSCRSCW